MSIKVFDNQQMQILKVVFGQWEVLHGTINWIFIRIEYIFYLNNLCRTLVMREWYCKQYNLKTSLNILRPAWIKDDIEWLDNSFSYNEGDDNTTR